MNVPAELNKVWVKPHLNSKGVWVAGHWRNPWPVSTKRYYFTQINGTDHEVEENSDGSRFCWTCNTTVDGDHSHDPVSAS